MEAAALLMFEGMLMVTVTVSGNTFKNCILRALAGKRSQIRFSHKHGGHCCVKLVLLILVLEEQQNKQETNPPVMPCSHYVGKKLLYKVFLEIVCEVTKAPIYIYFSS